MITLGQVGYEAYFKTAKGLTYDGKAMPTWSILESTEAGRETIRRWEVAAKMIVLAVVNEATKQAAEAFEGEPT